MLKVKRKPYPTMEMMLKKMGNLEGHWNLPQIFVIMNLHQSIFFFGLLFIFCSKHKLKNKTNFYNLDEAS
jgi:hypothetical protein